jgi:type I restriction enzyme S subunit
VKTGEVNYHVIESTEEQVTELALRETALRLYPKDTLLLAMYGQGITRGKVGILGIGATINQACAAIKPLVKDVSVSYLYHYLDSCILNR